MTTATSKLDPTLSGAADLARAALIDQAGPGDVGEHLGVVAEGDRVATHLFEALMPGYRGWRWSVTVARASRQKAVTIDEVVLTPGDDAIRAPEWVPYTERLQPGDLSPGDLLPVADDDPRLVPTYSFGDPDGPGAIGGVGLDRDEREQVVEVARELFLGRVRTLSPEGRDLAAERWYDGDGGPESPLALVAPDHCDTCGFLVRLAGPLTSTFGVCANGNANDDGRVVTFDHGCGAHSEVSLGRKYAPEPMPDHVFDTLTIDEIESF